MASDQYHHMDKPYTIGCMVVTQGLAKHSAMAACTCQSPCIPVIVPPCTDNRSHRCEEYSHESVTCRQLPNVIRQFEEVQREKQVWLPWPS